MATKKKRMSVYFDEELKAALEKEAKRTRRSVNNLIEVFVAKGLGLEEKSDE